MAYRTDHPGTKTRSTRRMRARGQPGSLYRKECFRCAFPKDPAGLNPYQRALMEIEDVSGVSHTVWMNQEDSIWNRMHYERMCELAEIRRLEGAVLTKDIYRMESGETVTSSVLPGVAA